MSLQHINNKMQAEYNISKGKTNTMRAVYTLKEYIAPLEPMLMVYLDGKFVQSEVYVFHGDKFVKGQLNTKV